MSHKDPVTPELRFAVMKRDKTCVGPLVGMPKPCGSQFGSGSTVSLELDHVDNAGFGKRGPSSLGNLVVLCGYHHRVKTEASKTWKPLLRKYLEGINA
jgi:hypothetical protein